MFKNRVLPTLILLGLIVACTLAPALPERTPVQVASTATATPVTPAATPTERRPTPTPSAAPAPTPTPAEPVFFGSWQMLRRTKAPSLAYAAGFLDAEFGITVGHQGDTRYTRDGGQTWERGESRSLCGQGLDIVDEQIAWYCGAPWTGYGSKGFVRLSADGGQTWQPVTGYGPPHPKHCRFLSLLDAQTGWAATPYQIGMTADGGETWTDLPLPEGIADIAAIALRTAADGYLLDVEGTIYLTQDAGQTWSTHRLGREGGKRLSTGSQPTAALRFHDADRGIAILQDTHHLWTAHTTNGGQTWQWEEIPGVPTRCTLYLARDGETLTLFDGAEIIVLRYRGTAQ